MTSSRSPCAGNNAFDCRLVIVSIAAPPFHMAAESEPVRIPITGELDLHTFQPAEIPRLIDSYLAACQERGLREVRIVHGKGTGTLRETVHALLRRSPLVESFRIGDETTGSWGATLARLKPRPAGRHGPES